MSAPNTAQTSPMSAAMGLLPQQPPAPQPSAPEEPPITDKGGPRAQTAWLMYRNMGPGRSLRKLALEWEKDTGKSYIARKGALERWSKHYNWPVDAMAWDAEQTDTERREKDAARKVMDEQQALMAKLATTRAQQRINALMAADERAQADYDQELQAWSTAMAAWAALVQSGEASPEQILNPPKKPKPPRVNFTAHALVQYWERTTQLERMAREAATAVVAVQSDQPQLPPVVTVNMASAPPPEPIDPLEAKGQLPPAVVAAARAAMPTPLVGLPTQRPEWDDEDDDE